MLSTDGFKISKRKAHLAMGPDADRTSFIYWSDVKRQWEWSYSNTKIVELIGSQSVPTGGLPEIKKFLGALNGDEKVFCDSFNRFYSDMAGLITSVKKPVDPECDLYETLLDMRLLREHTSFPCRILDIGPGAGRNMIGAFLGQKKKGNVYVGIESVGMCYSFQNLAASFLGVRDKNINFVDLLDYDLAREPAPKIAEAEADTIFHLPLWMDDQLPDRHFDLIICNYVLDDLSASDFNRVTKILGRVLADDGVIYCRGSQQRSMLSNMYLYGMGTFHGQDITSSILSSGMKVKDCQLIGAQLTRVFARSESKAHQKTEARYADFTEDVPLVEAVQEDYIKEHLRGLKGADKRVVIWGDPGYEHYYKHIAPHIDGIKVIGFTNRWVMGGVRGFVHRIITGIKSAVSDYKEYPPDDIAKISPDVIIITSMLDKSILRQIKEITGTGKYKVAKRFNYPVAFVYRDED